METDPSNVPGGKSVKRPAEGETAELHTELSGPPVKSAKLDLHSPLNSQSNDEESDEITARDLESMTREEIMAELNLLSTGSPTSPKKNDDDKDSINTDISSENEIDPNEEETKNGTREEEHYTTAGALVSLKEVCVVVSNNEVRLQQEVFALKKTIKKLKRQKSKLSQQLTESEMETENIQNQYAIMKSEMLQEAMKVKSGVAECMAFVTNYIKRQYEKQSETGLYRFGRITSDSGNVNKLIKNYDEVPTVCFPRLAELVFGRKYCLDNVLMGTRQVKGGFEPKARDALINFCRFHLKKPTTHEKLVHAFSTWRSQHWPAKAKLVKAPILEVLDAIKDDSESTEDANTD